MTLPRRPPGAPNDVDQRIARRLARRLDRCERLVQHEDPIGHCIPHLLQGQAIQRRKDLKNRRMRNEQSLHATIAAQLGPHRGHAIAAPRRVLEPSVNVATHFYRKICKLSLPLRHSMRIVQRWRHIPPRKEPAPPTLIRR